MQLIVYGVFNISGIAKGEFWELNPHWLRGNEIFHVEKSYFQVF